MPILAVLSGPAIKPPDGPFVILARKPDQLVILPLNNLNTSGKTATLTITTIDVDPAKGSPPSVDDLLEEVEQDIDVEIDCRKKLVRLTSEMKVDAADRVQLVTLSEHEKDWHPLAVQLPPMIAVNRVACDKLDVSKYSRPNLRASMQTLKVYPLGNR